MPQLILSQEIDTPNGPRREFTLPERATLALVRGLKLPFAVNPDGSVAVAVEGDQLIQFIHNLIRITPPFVERIPLEQVAEILQAALPLLPAAWRSFLPTGSASSPS